MADSFRKKRGSGFDPMEEDASQLKLGPEFVDATCLLNSEVALLLQEAIEPDKDLPEMVQKSIDYVQRFGHFNTPTAAREARRLLERYNLEKFELAAIGNLCPTEPSEARALVPTLVRFSDPYITDMLVDLAKFTTGFSQVESQSEEVDMSTN